MPPQANTSQDPFGQIVDKLKSANNVLVTVSNNPTVDQLAACIGLTVALNKLGKHGTAVYSGRTPSVIEFLEPEKTLESNTDSLRDFIIALDKSKADKLRYKVEDEVVKIFITPYKTSIGEKDLEFSQGDFNVDAVLALGVHQRSELDEAIVSHGRILHDAAILSINTSSQNELGSIDWSDAGASSLCEMVSDIVNELGKDAFDPQIATALLTGIVAETDRFSNEKASPHTMSVSGTLMAAGASSQLVASKLETAEGVSESIQDDTSSDQDQITDQESNPDGMIQIEHDNEPVADLPEVQDLSASEPMSVPESTPEAENDIHNEIHFDERDALKPLEDSPSSEPSSREHSKPDGSSTSMIMDPPQFGGQLTANSVNTDYQEPASIDPLGVQPSELPILSRNSPPADSPDPYIPTPVSDPPQTKSPVPPINDKQTLSEIEKAVDSAHLKNQPAQSGPASPVDELRQEVEQAANMTTFQPEPIAALNAQDFGLDLGHGKPASETETTKPEDQNQGVTSLPPVTNTSDEDTIESILGKNNSKSNSSPPPPVPPPMMPPPV